MSKTTTFLLVTSRWLLSPSIIRRQGDCSRWHSPIYRVQFAIVKEDWFSLRPYVPAKSRKILKNISNTNGIARTRRALRRYDKRLQTFQQIVYMCVATISRNVSAVDLNDPVPGFRLRFCPPFYRHRSDNARRPHDFNDAKLGSTPS